MVGLLSQTFYIVNTHLPISFLHTVSLLLVRKIVVVCLLCSCREAESTQSSLAKDFPIRYFVIAPLAFFVLNHCLFVVAAFLISTYTLTWFLRHVLSSGLKEDFLTVKESSHILTYPLKTSGSYILMSTSLHTSGLFLMKS